MAFEETERAKVAAHVISGERDGLGDTRKHEPCKLQTCTKLDGLRILLPSYFSYQDRGSSSSVAYTWKVARGPPLWTPVWYGAIYYDLHRKMGHGCDQGGGRPKGQITP